MSLKEGHALFKVCLPDYQCPCVPHGLGLTIWKSNPAHTPQILTHQVFVLIVSWRISQDDILVHLHLHLLSVTGKRTCQQSPDVVDHGADEREEKFMYYLNDSVYGSFNCIMFDHATVTPKPLQVCEGCLKRRGLFTMFEFFVSPGKFWSIQTFYATAFLKLVWSWA